GPQFRVPADRRRSVRLPWSLLPHGFCGRFPGNDQEDVEEVEINWKVQAPAECHELEEPSSLLVRQSKESVHHGPKAAGVSGAGNAFNLKTCLRQSLAQRRRGEIIEMRRWMDLAPALPAEPGEPAFNVPGCQEKHSARLEPGRRLPERQDGMGKMLDRVPQADHVPALRLVRQREEVLP